MIMQFLSVFFASLALWALFYDYVVRSGESILLAGETWYILSKESLNLAQAVIERYIWPPLWGEVIVPFLQTPFWLVCLSLSLIFGLLWLIQQRRNRF